MPGGCFEVLCRPNGEQSKQNFRRYRIRTFPSIRALGANSLPQFAHSLIAIGLWTRFRGPRSGRCGRQAKQRCRPRRSMRRPSTITDVGIVAPQSRHMAGSNISSNHLWCQERARPRRIRRLLRPRKTEARLPAGLFAAPRGGFEPPTWRLRAIPRFPSGTDYLFAIALEALGAGRIVSEPSRSVLRAWLRIAMVTTHRRFPAIHPVTPLSFPKGLPLTLKPLALPLSYQGTCTHHSRRGR